MIFKYAIGTYNKGVNSSRILKYCFGRYNRVNIKGTRVIFIKNMLKLTKLTLFLQ